MTQMSVQPRHLNGLTNRVGIGARSCNVEPTEHDGQRVRYFMQRAGQIGVAH